MNGATRTYNAANQMTNDGINTLTYDPNGNLTSDGTNTYTWDRANRMLTAPNNTSYTYDGLGNRTQQTTNRVVTNYLLDLQPGLTKVLAATTGTNTDHYIHAPRGLHAMESHAGDWSYMAQDGLGSVRSLIDSTLGVDTTHSYDPYGNYIGTAPTTAYFGFTGEQTDANGQLYLRARYYDPSIGVFNSLDPFEGLVARPMSLNGYSWVEGNVPNMVDPSGLTINWSNLYENAPLEFLNAAFDNVSYSQYVADAYHSGFIPRNGDGRFIQDFSQLSLIVALSQAKCSGREPTTDYGRWEFLLRLFANGADITDRNVTSVEALFTRYLANQPSSVHQRCKDFTNIPNLCIDKMVASVYTYRGNRSRTDALRSCLPLHAHSANMSNPRGSGSMEGYLESTCSTYGELSPYSSRKLNFTGCDYVGGRLIPDFAQIRTVGVYGGAEAYLLAGGGIGSVFFVDSVTGESGNYTVLQIGAGVGLNLLGGQIILSEAPLRDITGLSVNASFRSLSASMSVDRLCNGSLGFGGIGVDLTFNMTISATLKTPPFYTGPIISPPILFP